MLAGRKPFAGDDVGSVLLAHMTQPIPSLHQLNATVPQVLVEIVEKLLQKDPTDRYQTASAVLHDLRDLAQAIDAGQSNPRFSIGLRDRRASIADPILVGRTAEIQQFRDALDQARRVGNCLTLECGASASRRQ